jgi:hypothetical protein
MAKADLIPVERIEKAILLIRGQKVLLDRDLAELYEVPTKRLNEQVRRNLRRFPADFMFFTEQGVAMRSSVLHSERAIEVNIAIMRAFVRLRKVLASHKDLARKLEELERKLGEHDQKFHVVFEAIRQLMTPPQEPAKKRRIGFSTG